MPDTPTIPDTVQDIEKLLARVERGDTKVLPALRALLQQQPALASLLGDMAAHVQGVMLAQLAENNQGLRLCLETTIQEMKKTLAGPQSSPLETLLIERIVLDWLALHTLELYDVAGQSKTRTLTQAESMAKRIDRAHRRYLRSLMALAQMRRLLTPLVLVQMGLHAHQHLPAAPSPQ